MCHMSHVTCHVSHIMCHMSHVTCHNYLFNFFLQCVAASRRRVCYQQALPRLVVEQPRHHRVSLLYDRSPQIGFFIKLSFNFFSSI